MLEGFNAAQHTQCITLILSLYRSDKDFGYVFVINETPDSEESDVWRV